MLLLAISWKVWAAIGVLFLYALLRRLVRQWLRRRRAARQGSKRP